MPLSTPASSPPLPAPESESARLPALDPFGIAQGSDLSNLANWFAKEVQPLQAGLRDWLRSRFPWLSDVDGIAQEALFRLWKRQQKPGATPLRSPRAALYTIARNAAIDCRRHEAVMKTDLVAEFGGLHVLDEGANVVETVSARQELEFLAEAFRELPVRCRQVMTLTKIYGLTEREVGERLDLADSTVRTHIVRGMKHCVEYLRRRGIERRPR